MTAAALAQCTPMSKVPAHPFLHTVGLTALAMTAFAANSLLCRAALAHEDSDATTFTTIRLASGAATLSLITLRRTRSKPSQSFAWLSALALFAYAIGFSLAYVRISAGTGALLLFGAVQLTMIGAGMRAGERPRLNEWAGLALSILGLVVLTRPGLQRPDPVGALLMLCAGIAWGVYSLRGRRSGSDPISMNASSFVRAALVSGVAWALAATFGAIHCDWKGAFLAIVSGAITSGLGYVIWYAALRGLSATRAAIVQLSVPPLAAVGGVLVLGETFSTRIALASGLILGGIALAVLGKHALPAQRIRVDR